MKILTFFTHHPKLGIALIIMFFFAVVTLILLVTKSSIKYQPDNLTRETAPFSPITTAIPPAVIVLRSTDLSLKDIPITFLLDTPSLPTESSVYSVSSEANNPAFAQRVANTFAFSSQPNTEQNSLGQTVATWTDTTNTQTLSYSLSTGYFFYTNAYTPAKTSDTKKMKNLEEVTRNATDFLIKHGLTYPDLKTSNNNIVFYGGDDDLEIVPSFDRASLYSVSFERQLDNTRVIGQFANISSAILWVNEFGVIQKMQYQYAPLAGQRSKINLLSWEEAKKALPSFGSIVKLGDDESLSPLASGITHIDITSVAVRYFDDRKTNFIQPVFVFSGEATMDTTNKKSIIVYLPAGKK